MTDIDNRLDKSSIEPSGINRKKVLKINIQRKFNITLQDAFPLCVILAEDKLLPWFYEHYMTLCGYIYEKDTYGFRSHVFVHDRMFYSYNDFIDSRIMEYSFIDHHIFDQIQDLIYVMKSRIESGHYIIIFLDEYYIEGREAYQTYHYKHEFLLHGYDEEERLFHTAAFYNRAFTDFTMSFDTFLTAAESKEGFRNDADWMLNKTMMFMKPVPHEEKYPFSIKNFLSKLKSYLDGTIDETEVYYMRLYLGEYDDRIMMYGLNVYQVLDHYLSIIIDSIDQVTDKDFYTFGSGVMDRYIIFHSFIEHHKGLLERFDYLDEHFHMPASYHNRRNEFELLIKKLKTAGVKYRKLIIARTNYTKEENLLKTKKIFKEIKEILDAVKPKEEEILRNIYKIIEEVKI